MGVSVVQGVWTSRVEVQHASAQTRVPSTDVATSGWTIVNLSVSMLLNIGHRDALLFVRLHNIGNELAFSASTIGTVRPPSPLPGRSVAAGLQLAF